VFLLIKHASILTPVIYMKDMGGAWLHDSLNRNVS